jgi:hypothetical protein
MAPYERETGDNVILGGAQRACGAGRCKGLSEVGEVVVISEDSNLLLKCDAMDISAENLRYGKVTLDRVDQVFCGVEEFDVDEDVLQSFSDSAAPGERWIPFDAVSQLHGREVPWNLGAVLRCEDSVDRHPSRFGPGAPHRPALRPLLGSQTRGLSPTTDSRLCAARSLPGAGHGVPAGSRGSAGGGGWSRRVGQDPHAGGGGAVHAGGPAHQAAGVAPVRAAVPGLRLRQRRHAAAAGACVQPVRAGLPAGRLREQAEPVAGAVLPGHAVAVLRQRTRLSQRAAGHGAPDNALDLHAARARHRAGHRPGGRAAEWRSALWPRR